jgi:hypothetical protein
MSSSAPDLWGKLGIWGYNSSQTHWRSKISEAMGKGMKLKLFLKLLLYFLILLVMGINGAWHLALLLSPPKTAPGLGIWFWLYLMILPALGLLGIAALALKKTLNLSGWIGGLPLLYVGTLILLLFFSYPLGFAWILDALFSQGGFEFFLGILFTITLVGLLVTMVRR